MVVIVVFLLLLWGYCVLRDGLTRRAMHTTLASWFYSACPLLLPPLDVAASTASLVRSLISPLSPLSDQAPSRPANTQLH